MGTRFGATVRNAIRAERHRKQMTQSQLAAAMGLGYTKRVIYNIEKGKRPVQVDELVDFCRALEVSLARLLVDVLPKDWSFK
jgi:transcriptional regulator with XRE-family HTH domain